MAINQVWAHLGCKLQPWELSHSGTALQSPQHRKKSCTRSSTRKDFCDAGTVLRGPCSSALLWSLSTTSLSLGAFHTRLLPDTRAPGTQLNPVLCSKAAAGLGQCSNTVCVITHSQLRGTICFSGGQSFQGWACLCPLSEGDLRASTACQPPGQWPGTTEPLQPAGTALPLAAWSWDNDTGPFR